MRAIFKYHFYQWFCWTKYEALDLGWSISKHFYHRRIRENARAVVSPIMQDLVSSGKITVFEAQKLFEKWMNK